MTDPIKNLAPELKAALDVSFFTVLLGSLADLVPALAALSTLIWTLIRIYETDTVQGTLGKRGKDDD